MQHSPGSGALELTRTRYQQGSLILENRKSGPAVWVYRWRETGPDGGRVKRKQIVGTKTALPSKAAAMRAMEGLRLDINVDSVGIGSTPLTISQLIAHYRLTELDTGNSKTARTKQVYEDQLARVITPRWGNLRLKDVKPIAVEAWLKQLPVAPASRYKTKGVLSVLFQHAMRYGWASANPIRLVRQSALPVHEQIVLTPVEISALIGQLHDPFRCLILLACVTGLRRGELFGLKWQDISFEEREIRIVRSVVDQIEGPPKTLASRRPIPMSVELASSLKAWLGHTAFPASGDWVFASPQVLGTKPYWPNAVLIRHVLPAAERAGITKKIGWHTFRRTLSTLLISSGASVKTAQDLLRHSSPVMTIGIYAKSVTADKRLAQDAIAAMFLGKSDNPVSEKK